MPDFLCQGKCLTAAKLNRGTAETWHRPPGMVVCLLSVSAHPSANLEVDFVWSVNCFPSIALSSVISVTRTSRILHDISLLFCLAGRPLSVGLNWLPVCFARWSLCPSSGTATHLSSLSSCCVSPLPRYSSALWSARSSVKVSLPLLLGKVLRD